jgi:beta-glucanase (GH16 family)
MMKNKIALLFLFSMVLWSCSDDDTPSNRIEAPEGYTLLWNDEFDEGMIDPAKWTFETGDGTDYGLPRGWGNNELQIYTSSDNNASVGMDGDLSVLKITAIKTGENSYTSAKMTTNGLFSMRFGRVDVRAKLPEGQGIWPAIWMLGDNRPIVDWPGCGEIDIMEMLGNNPSKMYGTLHYVNGENRKGERQGDKTLSGTAFSDDYHVFSIDWTPQSIKFMVDNVQYFESPIEDDMKEFLRSFYLIMNVAVGGFWPGYPDNTTTFPQTMYVDYVRVFTKDGFVAPDAPVLDIAEETLGQVLEPNIADNAIKEGFDELGALSIVAFGGGGEPFIETSETAIDGDLSLVLDYPGGSWGGAYILMEQPRNMSIFTHLVFSLHKPDNLFDGEIKLESRGGRFGAVFLKDYEPTSVANGFVEYVIPLSDFGNLDLIQVNIPFALWNPVNSSGNFVPFRVLVDKVYFDNR